MSCKQQSYSDNYAGLEGKQNIYNYIKVIIEQISLVNVISGSMFSIAHFCWQSRLTF